MKSFGAACLVFLVLLLGACKAKEEKTENPSAEKTAVDSLPENIGDKTAPTAIKAYKGAKEVKKRIDAQREKDAKVLKESN